MSTSFFEPHPTKPHGTCQDCPELLPTDADTQHHMAETSAASKNKSSHTVSITNPSREERIQSRIDGIIEDAIDEAIQEITDLTDTDDSLTPEEIAEALGWHDAFADAYREHLAEEAEED